MRDLIDRQAAIDEIDEEISIESHFSHQVTLLHAKRRIERMPSVLPERDIPMKPNETIDSSWGIRKKQAVCPKCDYYLNRIYFLGDSKNKKVTYCEICGQAIDWEGWEWEDE